MIRPSRVRHLTAVPSQPMSAEPRPVVEARGVGVRYGSRWSLVDCNLQIPAGAVVAVVGRNGAGKSTLLHVLAGLQRPSSGSVSVLGEASWPASGRMLSRIGFVGQERPLYQALRVRDLLRMGQRLNPYWDQRYAVERLEDRAIPVDERVRRLSRGQQTQVALVMALAKRPELLILDEPLADLDPVARRDVMGTVMLELAERNVTVVMASHSLADLTRACDWLIILDRGRVRVAASVETLLADHRIVIGPTALADRVVRDAVVAQYRGERSSVLLVASNDAVSEQDPRWQRREPTVEDIVFAHLRSAREMP